MSRYINSNVIKFETFEEVCKYIEGKYTTKAVIPRLDDTSIINIEGIEFFAINFNDIFSNSYAYMSIVDIDLEDKANVGVVCSMNSDKQKYINSAEISYDETGHMLLYVPKESGEEISKNKLKMELFVIVFNSSKVVDWISRYFSIKF